VDTKLRILHLEDSEADGELLEHSLAQAGLDCGITRVETRSAFVAALDEGRYDLIVSDFSLPDFDGMSALAAFRQRDRETPFIFVSGTIGEERAVESLRRGATDYILKDRVSRLPSAVRRAMQERAEHEARVAAEQQLARTQRLETVGMIAGGVAHDLNNVLAPLLMGIASLKRRVTDDAGQRLLSTMEVSIERGADIVRQVLMFARGSGEAASFDGKAMIRGIEKLLAAALPRNVELTLEVADDLARLSGDATQLQQVLLNLCINARDAMPKGGRLLVQAQNVALDGRRAGEHVRIRVKDTGLGMPPEVQAKVFEPFFTTKEQGTGIGLSTVSSIVSRHGGFIELDSAPGEGTEFRVFLPADAPAAPVPAPAAAVGAGRTLLLVDDGALREIMKETLGAYGYEVLTAEGTDQAVELYRGNRGRIAAVLVSLSVPEIDGVDLVGRLAETDPKIKIINTSGFSEALSAQRFENVVRATLSRPYSAERLLEAVSRVLQMS
jgi:signal transduction histidine kinase